MTDRSSVLALYRQWLMDRWRKGRLLPDDVHALQVFCEVHQITPEEHQAAVREVGLDERDLVDENSRPFEEWLRARRLHPAAGAGALRYDVSENSTVWKKKLALPTNLQNGLAIAAGLILVVAIILIIFQIV